MGSMDAEYGQILRKVVEEYGQETLLNDKGRRATAFMADFRPESRKENRLLRMVLNEGIGEKIYGEIILQGQDAVICRERYIKHLCDELVITREAAVFVVNCICFAFGIEGFDETGERVLKSGDIPAGIKDPAELYEILKKYTATGWGAFGGCKCTVIEIPSNVKQIGYGSFYGWRGDKAILPGEAEIEPGAFCIPLGTDGGPSHIEFSQGSRYSAENGYLVDQRTKTLVGTYVEAWRRRGKRNYERTEYRKPILLYIPEGVARIPAHSINDEAEEIFIPQTVNEIELHDAGFRYGAWVKVDERNETYQSIGGVLFDAFGRKLLRYLGKNSEWEYTFPTETESVGEGAFSKSYVKKVYLGEELKEIEDTAFWGCEKLESVSIPQSVRRIGKQAFAGCQNLHFLELPDSVNQIGADAFTYCGTGNGNRIGGSLTFGMKERDIRKCKVKGELKSEFYILYDNNSYVAEYCKRKEIRSGRIFKANCKATCRVGDIQETYRLTENLRGYLGIGAEAIRGSFGEAAEGAYGGFTAGAAGENGVVKIPANIKVIRQNAFSDCPGLRKIVFLSDVIIEPGAFAGCPDLCMVELPRNSRYAFYQGCLVEKEGKTLIYGGLDANSGEGCCRIPEGVVSIPRQTIMGNVKKVYIPKSTKWVEISNFAGGALEYIEAAEGGYFGKTVGGVLYSKDGTCLLKYPPGKKDRRYQVAAGTVAIEHAAFGLADYLQEVVLNEELKAIGNFSFVGCFELSEIKLPRGLRRIGRSAFEGCASLSRIELYEQVTEIGENAFSDCGEDLEKGEFKVIIHNNPYAEDYCKRHNIPYKSVRAWFGR